MVKKILIGLLIVFVIIQFFRPAKNKSEGVEANSLAGHYQVPDSLQAIFKRACYDCHSNNTRYPWYFSIQPVAWWMENHVNEAKHGLNFSEFDTLTTRRKLKKLKQISEEVTEGSMPLSSYLWIHKEAKLSKADVTAISDWAEALVMKIDSTGK